MPFDKHGQFDKEKGLPDNAGQPFGSGVAVWLRNQILETLKDEGEYLIAQAYAHHKDNRYEWLCQQLIDFGYRDIVEEYQQRKKEANRVSRIRRQIAFKRGHNKTYQQYIEQSSDLGAIAYWQKEIRKNEKYIQTHEAQLKESNSNGTQWD